MLFPQPPSKPSPLPKPKAFGFLSLRDAPQLDVYKIQIIYYQADRFEHSSQKWKKRVLYRKRVQANIPVMQKHKNFPHSIAVSYTHLDVYKRQRKTHSIEITGV